MDMVNVPMKEYLDIYMNPNKVHEVITTPINYFNLINQGVMVYDENGHLLNVTHAIRAGISSHHNNFTIWFSDGEKRRYMNRVFTSYEEAEEFLESIYQIKR